MVDQYIFLSSLRKKIHDQDLDSSILELCTEYKGNLKRNKF